MPSDQSTLDAPETPASSPAASDAPGTTAPDTDPFQTAASDLLGDEAPPAAPETAEEPLEAPAGAPDAEETPDSPPDAPDGTPEPPTEFDIAVPLPGEFAPPGPDGKPAASTRKGLVELAFPTQEARDAIAFHVKRSAEFDTLAADAQAGIEARATLAHLEAAPEQAMFQLEQVKPDAAKSYVENWMQRNPVAAALAVRDLLGYAVSENGNEERLTDKAELAKLRAAEALRAGQTTYQSTVQQQRFIAAGKDTIRSLAQTGGIDLQSRPGQYVAQQLATAFEQHFTQHPSATRQDLAALPVVRDILNDYQRLVAHPTAPTKAAVKATPTGPAKFAQQAQVAKNAAKLAPGQTRIAALRAEKFKRGTTLDDLP